MEVKELDKVLAFHRAGLDQYRQFMSPSAQYMEEQTVRALSVLRLLMVEKTTKRAESKRVIVHLQDQSLPNQPIHYEVRNKHLQLTIHREEVTCKRCLAMLRKLKRGD